MEALRSVAVDKVLRDFDAPRVIHFMSLDIEGAEYLVLKAFPWNLHTVYVIAIERPDLCSRVYLRKAGFHYLADPYSSRQDEIWLHSSTPNFARIMREMGTREPLARYFFAEELEGKPLKSSDLLASCRDLAKEVLEDVLSHHPGQTL